MSELADLDLKDSNHFQLLNASSISDLISTLGSGWMVTDKKIEKSFYFQTFKESITFVNAIATICEEVNHHAHILVEYKSVKICIWTHNVKGLTRADFILGARINRLTLNREI